jgi:hypothetical protein
MLSKIVARYFNIPLHRKPSVFAKYAIEGIDDLRGRAEFICDELIKMTREKKISWRGTVNKEFFIVTDSDGCGCIIVLRRKTPPVDRLDGDKYILTVFNEREVGEEINICGYSKSQDAFLPVVDLWDMVVEGKLRDVVIRHTCNTANFDPSKDVCPACSRIKKSGE